VSSIFKSPVTAQRRGGIRAFCGAVLVATLALAACSKTSEPPVKGAPPRLRLITSQQYINTLVHVFGSSLDLDMKFPPMRRTDGLLENGATVAGVTATQLEQFQRAAASVANQVVNESHRNYLLPCKPADEKAPDKACATQFLTEVGPLLMRRPMTAAETQVYVSQAGEAAEKVNDFYAGLGMALEGMLISPDVLFIAEKGEPDPEHPGKFRLDRYSLAQRLSFFLWNSGPDAQILQAAKSGELQTAQGREKVVAMMIASPRIEDGMRAFFDDMFAFDDFDSLSKDATVYPFFTGVTVTDAREQTLRTVIDQLIVKKKDYRDLYTTRETFLSPALAALYNLPSAPGWQPYEFPVDSPRQGVLTQISFLAVHAHPGRSSPTRRGKALRELLLCQNVPNPPPNVDFSALENPDAHYKTQRERVGVHLKNATCAGCHKIMDPMGLALENFDGAGRYRATENGAAIDSSGNLDGKQFANVQGLAQALHDSPTLPSCLVSRIYSYGAGGVPPPVDRPLLTYLNKSFADEGYRIPDLLKTIALSNSFSQVTRVQPSTAPLPQDEAPEKPQQVTLNQH
jgi:Protein of unknown function (DUF1588)/Protein of unknown function (DUF1592)/Protein of unknown function (DUF1585)/Protein of unknown function (DUF1595)/Protein of unknown function (DUF1587)